MPPPGYTSQTIVGGDARSLGAIRSSSLSMRKRLGFASFRTSVVFSSLRGSMTEPPSLKAVCDGDRSRRADRAPGRCAASVASLGREVLTGRFWEFAKVFDSGRRVSRGGIHAGQGGGVPGDLLGLMGSARA